MIKIKNIKWDTEVDGEVIPQEELGLPTDIEIDDDRIQSLDADAVNDWLANEYGYCVFDYDLCQIPYGRAIELLDAVINHMCVAEKPKTVIEELSNIGFTDNELAFLNFSKSDIEECFEDSSEE